MYSGLKVLAVMAQLRSLGEDCPTVNVCTSNRQTGRSSVANNPTV